MENKYDLKLTDNCAQLWNWISDGLGDLIILDVVMPDENGLDLIPKIKEIRPDVKIIIISAQNTILTAMQAVEKGAYEYLAKLFDLTELNKVIDTAFSDNNKYLDTYKKEDIKYIFGPFPHGVLFRDAIKIIRKIFPYFDTKQSVSRNNSKHTNTVLNFNRQIGRSR